MSTYSILHCPLTEINGAWRFERGINEGGTTFSTPGHLLHYVVKGNEEIIVNKRVYNVMAGTVIYYYEQEEVVTRFFEDTVFYSIAFKAPELPPLPFSRRVFNSGADIMDIFAKIYDIYTAQASNSSLRLFGLLSDLLVKLGFNEAGSDVCTHYEKIWRQIELWVRRERKYRAGMQEVCDEFNVSSATLHRVCRSASEKSFGKRLQQIRMEEAKALLIFSGLNVSETAQYLGYPRIHEFSREFSGYFKQPPSYFRR